MTRPLPDVARRSRVLAPLCLAALLASCGGGGGPEPSPYVLNIRYLGSAPNANVREAFGRAKRRIQGMITAPLGLVSLPQSFTNVVQCDAELDSYPDIDRDPIKGLDIYVAVVTIDGAGQQLGNAGPCLVRTSEQNHTALGVMRLDVVDLNSLSTDRLDALILHEMLHVVGIGTIWVDNGLLDQAGTANVTFNGPLARSACATTNGGTNTCATAVPVHNADGEGSADSHWRESVFANELMTPFLGSGTTPLSATSIQSLADLGYQVDASGADPFTLAAGLREMPDPAAPPPLKLAEPIKPRFGVSAGGTLVQLRP